MAQGASVPVVLKSQLETVMHCLSTVSKQSLSCGLVPVHRNVFSSGCLENDFCLSRSDRKTSRSIQVVGVTLIILISNLLSYFDCFMVVCSPESTM